VAAPAVAAGAAGGGGGAAGGGAAGGGGMSAGQAAKLGNGGRRQNGGGGGGAIGMVVVLGLIGFILLIFLLFMPIFLIAGIAGGEDSSDTFTSEFTCSGNSCFPFLKLPEGARPYQRIYIDAGKAYKVNPFLLMAVHEDESDYGRGAGDGIRDGINFAGCCAGPMQFSIASGATREEGGRGATWAGYSGAYQKATLPRKDVDYPNPTELHPNVYDAYDSIYAAAQYFSELGAGPELDERTYNALRSYKGTPPASDPFAQHDYDRAKELQKNSGVVPPPAVLAMYAKVEAIEQMKLPYDYGGGHGGPLFQPPYDCSSFVSAVLNAGGLIDYVTDTVGLASWGEAGEGRWMTVWTRGAGTFGHTFVEFHLGQTSRFAETNGDVTQHAGWRAHISGVGYAARHWPGM